MRWGRPNHEVLSYAKEEKIDLVCMGAYGKNFSMEGLFGSNVDRVLRQSPFPVFVARPFKPAASQASQNESVTCAAD